MWALFLCPTLMPTWPGPQHGRHAPSSLLPPASFSQRTPSPRNWPHPGHPHSYHPPWKDQLLGKEEVWAFSICKTLYLGPGPLQSSFAGGSGGRERAFSLQRWEPCVFSEPIASPPDTPKPLATTQETVSSISPHSTLLINRSNSERKEERAQTLKPWELVNQELKFKTNALSCGAPLHHFFFLFAVPLNHASPSETSTPS